MTARKPLDSMTSSTYWILARPQILCLASARRQDILDRLVAAGPCSVREFADSVGLAPSAIYHHLRRLEAVGLVRVTGTRVVRRRTEKIYGPVAERMRMARALGRRPVKEPVTRVVAAQCRQMHRDFANGIGRADARIDGPGRNLGFFRLVGSPDPVALAEINRHLERIGELLWSSGSGSHPPIAFAWTITPAGRTTRAGTHRRRKP